MTLPFTHAHLARYATEFGAARVAVPRHRRWYLCGRCGHWHTRRRNTNRRSAA